MDTVQNDCYSPHTGEHIHTAHAAPWMGRAGAPAPAYDNRAQGCFWRNGQWEIEEAMPAATPVPESITRRQGRLALLGAGLLDEVEAAISAIVDPAAKRAAQIEYEADTWERSNSFLQEMWAQLGGTSEELDALFITAFGL